MLFRHSPEMMTQHNEHMRGGQGTVAVKHLLKPDEMLGKGRLFAELTVPPGASVGLHRHEGDVEALSGVGETGEIKSGLGGGGHGKNLLKWV